MKVNVQKSILEIVQGDITQQDTEAIGNAVQPTPIAASRERWKKAKKIKSSMELPAKNVEAQWSSKPGGLADFQPVPTIPPVNSRSRLRQGSDASKRDATA